MLLAQYAEDKNLGTKTLPDIIEYGIFKLTDEALVKDVHHQNWLLKYRPILDIAYEWMSVHGMQREIGAWSGLMRTLLDLL